MAKPGGGKPDGGKPKPSGDKKSRRLVKRARRDVRLSNQPALNAIDRLIEQLNMDYQNKSQGTKSIYGGFQDAIAPLYKQYQKASGDIASDLQNQLAQFSGMLNGEGLPTEELAANTALYGQYGNNAFNSMANDAQRALGYNQSAMREGALSNRYAQGNLMQGLSDQLQEMYNRKASIYDTFAPQIQQRMDMLKDQARANRQDKAYSDMIAQLVGNQLNGGGGPRGGGGGPTGGGGGGNATFTPSDSFSGSTVATGGRGGGYQPASIQDWRHGDAGWGSLNRKQHRRIRNRGITKIQPSLGTINSNLGPSESGTWKTPVTDNSGFWDFDLPSWSEIFP